MNQESIKKFMQDIAKKAMDGDIQFTSKDGIQQHIPFDEVEYYGENLLFYYDNENLADSTPTATIPAECIRSIGITDEDVLADALWDYGIVIETKSSSACIYARTNDKLSLGDSPNQGKSVSLDTLIEKLAAHDTWIQVLLNSGDVVDSSSFNVQIADAYFTKVDDMKMAICFCNSNQAPIRIEDGKPLYHISSDTSLFIHKERIERIEELPVEKYGDMFEMPSKSIRSRVC